MTDTTTALPAPQSQDAVTGQAFCPGHLYQFSQHSSPRFIYTGASPGRYARQALPDAGELKPGRRSRVSMPTALTKVADEIGE
jgi:hypothetical protein